MVVVVEPVVFVVHSGPCGGDRCGGGQWVGFNSDSGHCGHCAGGMAVLVILVVVYIMMVVVLRGVVVVVKELTLIVIVLGII